MTTQEDIVREFGVIPTEEFDPLHEVNRRIAFLAEYLQASGQRSYVLGVSGGIDSSVASILARRATDILSMTGYNASFIAVRLPYGDQADEADCVNALSYIQPTETITINIKPATDAMFAALYPESESQPGWHIDYVQDFIKGNIKARQRMIAQYAIAGARAGLVIGTDHGSEGVMGFFTKHGDGACDLCPLFGLNKRQVRILGKFLGLPLELYEKPGTADLEDLKPGFLDEDAYGVPQEEIDDMLEGEIIRSRSLYKIIEQYEKTAHKRALPVTP